MTVTAAPVLTDALLDRCRERAPGYDRENRFFQEDFDELKAAGYLRMAVPKEFGGLGMTLAQVARETRQLAQYAPATALVHQHAQLLGGRRRGSAGAAATSRSSGSCARRPPAKSSPRATPSTATTFRACCRRRRPSASTAATSSPAARRSAA